MSAILCDDEFVPRERCGNPAPHADHGWRADGKRFRYLDDPTARWCEGVREQVNTNEEGTNY